MANLQSEQRLLGVLMQEPTLLLNSEKYLLTNDDFDNKLHQYIFYAISSMAYRGARTLTVQDVELALDNTAGGVLFKRQDGIGLLNDYISLANADNFDTYYRKAKKENLLRDLKESGFDVSLFYDENPLTKERLDINEKYLNMEISEIIDIIQGKILNIESEYVSNEASRTISAADGMRDLIEELAYAPDIGMPYQGKLFNQATAGMRRGTYLVRSADSGVGKALPNSTVIPTPNGFKAVKDIVEGDYLYDAFGKPTKVLGVYPQGLQGVYEVVFKDGRKALCNDQHLWSFNTKGQKPHSIKRRSFFTESLREIIDNRSLKSGRGTNNNILVPQHYAVEKEEKEFFLHPYVLGLLLGDGSFREHNRNKAIQFSSETSELPTSIAEIMGWELKENIANNFAWYFGNGSGGNVWVSHALKDYPDLIDTYSHNKFIPEDYLNGSIEQRRDLLNGLLDSDGSVDEKGRVIYTTNSEQLRDGVMELARSLGFFVSYGVDNHKETSTCWYIHIAGRPSDKVQLFRLRRKRERIVKWYNNGKRKESGEHNPIVEINDLGYEEEMTCFMVDNDEHLFLMNDYIVTHNTRAAMADACQLAFPITYNQEIAKWERTGYNEKILFIITEQMFKEVQLMMIAYVSNINESKIKKNNLTKAEKEIVSQAISIIEEYTDNFLIIRIPEPTIKVMKNQIRTHVLQHDINYVFFDYIFINPSVLNEFKGVNLRNDEILLMMSTALKDLAIELDIFVATSTQTNSSDQKGNKDIRGGGSIAGAKAIQNKADVGCIMARPSVEELRLLENVLTQIPHEPNLVIDLYKNRGNPTTNVRIWSYFDMGAMRMHDMFVTNARGEAIDIEDDVDYVIKMDEPEFADTLSRLNK